MKFLFTAECTFEADSVDSVFEYLWRHFKELTDPEEELGPDTFASMRKGKLEINPVGGTYEYSKEDR